MVKGVTLVKLSTPYTVVCMEMGVGADLTSASKDVANVVDEYIPVSEDDESKPVIGKVFDSLKEAGNFYKMYA
jgi:hypothetical protein